MELIRISTAGSVDDGKSTLIGQLLIGTKSVSEDKLQSVREASLRKGFPQVDLSMLTDGLIVEREQGITIDVAHIYFSTPTRKYIIADSPGHLEFTRNMITGASTAEIFLILIDVQKGITDQTLRHAYIAGMLRAQHVVVCINKMDTVNYDQLKFEELCDHFLSYAQKLNFFPNPHFIPTSALVGDNLINSSIKTPWYKGLSLLQSIENCEVQQPHLPFRFRLQNILSVNSRKYYTGKVISGSIQSGDKISVLPSGKNSVITSILKGKDVFKEAKETESIIFELNPELSNIQGSLFTKAGEEPHLISVLKAEICWLNEEPGVANKTYLLQHGSQTSQAVLSLLYGQKNIKTLQFEDKKTKIDLNEITEISLRLESAIPIEAYSINKNNGRFILIDPLSNKTMAIGFVLE